MVRHSFAYLFERFPSFVQTFVYREAAEMVRQKMEPCLVSIRAPDDAAEVAEPLNLDVTYLPPNAELRAEIDRLREARKLPASIRHAITRARQEPDSNRLFEAVWLGPYLRRHGIKHVHAHFAGVAARTAWRLRALYGISYSFTGHANDIFCETSYPVSQADLIRDAKFIVTETDFARGWLETKYPRAHGKTFRVYNGIDSSFPPRQPAGEAPRIVSVGRLIEKKGFDDLIEACRQMRARSHRFECMIIGDGPLQSPLQMQIDRGFLGKSVQLLGARPQSEVRQLLASARLFVLPSVPESDGGSDNLPTVIMEAMMCGLPIVSTRLAGIPEMIQHGENGLLVSPRNPPSLAVAIEQLLRDVTFADRLGTHARGTALHKFSIEATTRTLKHLLVQRAPVRVPSGARQFDPSLRAPWWQRWLRR